MFFNFLLYVICLNVKVNILIIMSELFRCHSFIFYTKAYAYLEKSNLRDVMATSQNMRYSNEFIEGFEVTN